MLKLGVDDAGELPAATTPLLGRRRLISVRTYAEILLDRPDKDPYLAMAIEWLAVGPKAFKTTLDARFVDLDVTLLELIPSLARKDAEPLRVHDMGASDGRTSAELYTRLRALGPLEFTASDLYRTIYLVEPEDRAWYVAFDEDRQVVQYGRFGFVLSPLHPDNPFVYPVNRLVDRWLHRTLVPVAERCIAATELESIPELGTRRVGNLLVTSLMLICRECRALMQADAAFRFLRHDVRSRNAERFHLIRALNVFNHVDRSGQLEAIRSCHDSLHEGGLLLIGRSVQPGGETRASIWRRDGAALTWLRDFDGGAETKTLVAEALARR